MRTLSSLLFIMSLGFCGTINAAEPGLQQAPAYSPPTLSLTSAQSEWLRQHPILRVGVVANHLPPFDMLDNKRGYHGVSAEYTALIARAIHQQPQVQTYPSFEDAYKALHEGKIDTLMSATGDAPPDGVAFSAPYFLNHAVEVTCAGRQLDKNRPFTVAVLGSQPDNDAITRHYPNARIKTYPTLYQALLAVTNLQADTFLGDMTSTAYSIDRYNLASLSISNYSGLEQQGLHMAVRDDQTMLLSLLNEVITTIPTQTKQAIAGQWQVAHSPLAIPGRINLTDREQRWLQQHPTVYYQANNDRVPFIFADKLGAPAGLSVQMLNIISEKTGLTFSPVWADADTNTTSADRPVSLYPIMVHDRLPTVPGGQMIRVSDPYLISHLVIVGRKHQQDILQASDLINKRLAVATPNMLDDYIPSGIPGVRTLAAGSYIEAYQDVVNGSADATLANALTANFIIQNHFANDLQIMAPLSDRAVNIGFGVAGDAPELLSIINKALESIPPDELRGIQESWMLVSQPNTQWIQLKEWLWRGGILFGAGLLIFVSWFLVFMRQVKAREKAERALREQVNFQAVMMDGIPHPVYVRDRQLRLVTCNAAYEAALGVKRHELVGKTVKDLLPYIDADDDSPPMEELYRRMMASGEPFNQDKAIRVQGKRRDIYNWAVRLETEQGEAAGMVGGWLDITERTELLAALSAARQKAEQASEAKSVFLATMSHEIRTPMNALIGLLQLMSLNEQKNAREKLYLDTAQSSATSLLALIDDILDFSKMEAGKLPFRWQAVDIRQVLEEVINIFLPVAREKSLSLLSRVEANVGQGYRLDPLRFKQLLTNLIGNALKFTNEGEVQVILRYVQHTDGQDRLQLNINDSGIGIDPSDIPALFKPFSQAKSTLKRVSGGTGLGLSICKQLAQRMGGDILLHSQPGQGTQIEVQLALEPAALPLQQAPAALLLPQFPAKSRWLAAVVDDHPTNRMVLHEQLSLLGCDVVESEHGEQALQQCASQRFDIIFCDCNMPVMDGYEFTRRLRSGNHGTLNQHQSVLGFTANAQPEIRQQALAAGMNDCLVKPLNLAMLAPLLQHYLGEEPEVPDISPASERVERGYDETKVQQATFGDPKIAHRLLRSLIETNTNDLALITRAVASQSWPELTSLAHRMKGAARMIGAQLIIDLCEQLEMAEQQPEQSHVLAERLVQAVGQLHAQLAERNNAVTTV
ncbi:ATP-binding protein [Enterobacter asburiae]